MALGVWQNTIRGTLGRIIVNAQVTVTDSTTGVPRTLHADRAGALPLSNPCYTDADGFVRFYSDIGLVDITIEGGGKTQTLENVVLIDDV